MPLGLVLDIPGSIMGLLTTTLCYYLRLAIVVTVYSQDPTRVAGANKAMATIRDDCQGKA